MLKFVIAGVASLALVGSAVAADMPRPQPVVQSAPASGIARSGSPVSLPGGSELGVIDYAPTGAEKT